MEIQTKTNRVLAFTRAWRQLHVFTSNSDWLVVLFTSVAIGLSNYFGFSFTTLNWKPLYGTTLVFSHDTFLEQVFFLFNFLCLLDSTPFYKIMVPTVDTVRYDFLVYSLLQAKRPVLLTGPVGTGKTSLAQKVLQRLDPKIYSLLVINMSAQVCETQHLCIACSFPVTFDSNTMKLVQQEIKPSHIRMS